MPVLGSALGLVGQAKAHIAEFDQSSPHTAGRIRQVIGGVLVADGLVGLENPFDGQKKRAGILGAVVGMMIGVVFGGVGWYMMATAPHPDASAQGTVDGIQRTVNKGSTSCGVTATFVVAGKTYSTDSSGTSDGLCRYNKGDAITVKYERKDPTRNVVGSGLSWMPLAFIGMGALVFLLFLITFAIRAVSIIFGARLFFAGKKLVDANPGSASDEHVVEEVKARFTQAMMMARGR